MKTYWLIDANQRLHEVTADAPLSIGRGALNALILKDRLVSRTHARITFSPQGPVLTDRQSTNGTLVNGRPVDVILLKPGDVIQIGLSLFYVFQGTQTQAEAWLDRRARAHANKATIELQQHRPHPNEIAGSLSTLQLVTLLRSLVEQQNRGALELSRYGLPVGIIYLDDGNIVHAEMTGRPGGVQAFNDLIAMRHGDFIFHPKVAAPAATITGNPTALLLEACRQLDERGHS
jgi:hypothetical protein